MDFVVLGTAGGRLLDGLSEGVGDGVATVDTGSVFFATYTTTTAPAS